MPTRNHIVGIDLAVSFDEDVGTITVSRYRRPFKNFSGGWEVVETITNEADWYRTKYTTRITGDGNVAMIACFWSDVALIRSRNQPT